MIAQTIAELAAAVGRPFAEVHSWIDRSDWPFLTAGPWFEDDVSMIVGWAFVHFPPDGTPIDPLERFDPEDKDDEQLRAVKLNLYLQRGRLIELDRRKGC
jgi:hypothetical protein